VKVAARLLGSMPFKRNAARRHRITNWPAYEAGLQRRGDLALWLDEAALAGWLAPRRSTPGGQPLYSDLAIELVLTLRLVFRLALRQVAAFAASVLRLLGVELPRPGLRWPANRPTWPWTAPACSVRAGRVGRREARPREAAMAQAAPRRGRDHGRDRRPRADRGHGRRRSVGAGSAGAIGWHARQRDRGRRLRRRAHIRGGRGAPARPAAGRGRAPARVRSAEYGRHRAAEPARLPHPAHRGAGQDGVAASNRLRAPLARRDGLFANDKFCLTRQGRLALSWRRRGGPRQADRLLSRPGTAVPGGFCPSGADHEATALDGGAAPRQPPGSGAAVGSGLPATPVRAGRHPERFSGGHTGGGGT